MFANVGTGTEHLLSLTRPERVRVRANSAGTSAVDVRRRVVEKRQHGVDVAGCQQDRAASRHVAGLEVRPSEAHLKKLNEAIATAPRLPESLFTPSGR